MIFPLSLPGVLSGVTMVFIPSVSTFVISRLLGGGKSLLLGDLIEMQFLGSAYNPHLGSAISLVMMVIVLVCMGPHEPLRRGRGGGGAAVKRNGILSRLFIVLMFIFLYAPILVLIAFSFNNSKSNAVWGGFTLDWYVQLMNNRTVLQSHTRSRVVSALATAVATVVGTAAAIGFSSMKRRPGTPA